MIVPEKCSSPPRLSVHLLALCLVPSLSQVGIIRVTLHLLSTYCVQATRQDSCSPFHQCRASVKFIPVCARLSPGKVGSVCSSASCNLQRPRKVQGILTHHQPFEGGECFLHLHSRHTSEAVLMKWRKMEFQAELGGTCLCF